MPPRAARRSRRSRPREAPVDLDDGRSDEAALRRPVDHDRTGDHRERRRRLDAGDAADVEDDRVRARIRVRRVDGLAKAAMGRITGPIVDVVGRVHDEGRGRCACWCRECPADQSDSRNERAQRCGVPVHRNPPHPRWKWQSHPSSGTTSSRQPPLSRVVLQALERGTAKTSLRVLNDLLGRTRQAAGRRGVPYQSLIKVLIDQGVSRLERVPAGGRRRRGDGNLRRPRRTA